VATYSLSKSLDGIVDSWNATLLRGGFRLDGGYLRIPLTGVYAIWGQIEEAPEETSWRVVRLSKATKKIAAFVRIEQNYRESVVIADLVWCDRDDFLSLTVEPSVTKLPVVRLTVGLIAQNFENDRTS
jgi:hypothetical protein